MMDFQRYVFHQFYNLNNHNLNSANEFIFFVEIISQFLIIFVKVILILNFNFVCLFLFSLFVIVRHKCLLGRVLIL